MYDAKHRFFAFLGLLFFLLLTSTISFFGFESLLGYFDNLPTFTFSSWSVFAALSPLVIIPFLLMIIPVIIRGKQIEIKAGKRLLIFSLTSLVLIIIIMFAFSFIYKTFLNNKGYVECIETPMGWTPGMATKYSIKKSYCVK